MARVIHERKRTAGVPTFGEMADQVRESCKPLRAESPFERIASAKALKFSLGLAPYRTKGNLLSIRNLLES